MPHCQTRCVHRGCCKDQWFLKPRPPTVTSVPRGRSRQNRAFAVDLPLGRRPWGDLNADLELCCCCTRISLQPLRGINPIEKSSIGVADQIRSTAFHKCIENAHTQSNEDEWVNFNALFVFLQRSTKDLQVGERLEELQRALALLLLCNLIYYHVYRLQPLARVRTTSLAWPFFMPYCISSSSRTPLKACTTASHPKPTPTHRSRARNWAKNKGEDGDRGQGGV